MENIIWHSSESMPEIEDNSVTMLIGGGAYLGDDWGTYEKLYQKVLIEEGLRILKPDGILLSIQTNAYRNNVVVCKYKKLLDLLLPHYKLIDEKVWQRCELNFFQLPFSHVFVLTPKGSKVGRTKFNKRSREYLNGVWNYKQVHGGELNSWPRSLCKMFIETFTDKGDLIVDPFAGTCLLIKVALDMGRRARGYEINKELLPIIKNEFNQQNLFEV